MFRNRKSSELTLQEINLNIIKLKEGMNSQRVNFSLPVDHNIVITGNYLVGLLEGDGSFYLNKHDMTAHVSLVTTTVNRLVLEKIREFILSLLDEHSYMLGSTTKLINISNKKIKSGHRPISILEISQIDFICNVLIPYLDSIEFRTKKYQDYLDFKTIALLILEGKYLTNKGKELIIDLGNSMNNNRLSTNPNPFILDDNTKSELNILIKSDPLISIDSEGRAMVITEKKYIRSTYIIKVCLLNGLVNYFTSGISCAKFLHVSNDSITKRLNDGKPVKNKEGLVVAQWIKRIKVYSSLK
uniref:LAGLIDADG endonuclease n=1 Tax=Annulohypoxylon stygium TaxID=326628 RepID=V5REB9_9PEZI|nr:LAGLIDADG endonuclease [Annulohypoxylon stygium]AHB33528.1 LAGLIDADG endonuclease [Annulohypoxylon stygium]